MKAVLFIDNCFSASACAYPNNPPEKLENMALYKRDEQTNIVSPYRDGQIINFEREVEARYLLVLVLVESYFFN